VAAVLSDDTHILSGDALRSLEDHDTCQWCEYARRSLLQIAAVTVVRPLRVAAETSRAAARAAASGVLNDDGVSDRSTTSFVASTDGGSGSTADSVSEL
jgi:hypothetical protein